MNRTTLIILATLTATLMTTGCAVDQGDDDAINDALCAVFGDIGAGLTAIMYPAHQGEHDRGTLRGLCQILEDCEGQRPIALGESIDILLKASDPADSGKSEDVQVSSSGAAITVSQSSDNGCGMGHALLEATEIGTATITYTVDGNLVDTFPIEVAPAASASVTMAGLSQNDTPVLPVGEEDHLVLNVRDAAGRSLAIGQSVSWHIDDQSIASVVGEASKGTLQSVRGKAAGTTVVHARFGDFDAQFTLVVQ